MFMKVFVQKGLFILGSLCIVTVSQAQRFENIVKGNASNGNYLAQGYFSPALKAFGTGLNQGWYTTAKVHKPLGFDLTATVSGVMIPTSEEFFMVHNKNLQGGLSLVADHEGNTVTAEGSGSVPTVFGPRSTQSGFDYNGVDIPGVRGFSLKDKVKVNFLPVPIYSIGLGISKSTELKVRFLPTIQADHRRSEINMLGVGLLHDVKHYIPGLRMAPIDLSLFAGFTRLNVDSQIGNSTQRGEFAVSSTTTQVLISKKLGPFTLYGGAGYDFINSSIRIKGHYDLNNNGQNDDGETNPIHVKATTSGPRATAGFRLKFAVFTLHGDYTIQNFSTFSTGFGINVR
jgi:hypothetical protein